jgi:ankyrin repeat protein
MIIANFMLSSCLPQGDAGPGYRWELFNGTPEWELAKAASHEDTSRIYQIIKQGGVDINSKEPKFGQTVLTLAIANDKLNSVIALLKSGVDVNIRNSIGNQAIHEACKFPRLRPHSAEVIRLLIEYSANVNARSSGGIPMVPLAGTTSSLICTQILLNHGANLYFKDKNDTTYQSYVVWVSLLSAVGDSNMSVAKYIIVDKKMLVPNPICYSHAHEPLDIFTILNMPGFDRTPSMAESKKEILRFLHEIDFPRHGAYDQ